MKSPIKSLIATAMASAVIATGCSGKKENVADAAGKTLSETTAASDIRGRWYIENIVFNDSDYVRPEEAVPGVRQYISFEDSTYFIQTNCNTVSGPYMIKGDSIVLGDGAMTEKACDNMATEDALRKILPNIATLYIGNDSTARLNSRNPSEYIVLHKAAAQK